MKLKGKKITGHNIEICVIPRQEENLIFRCQSVLDMDSFEKLCPEPAVPTRRKPGGETVKEFEDPVYQAHLDQYNQKRVAYLIIKSLEATEDLEWETVKLGDPNSWLNYEKELKESGFNQFEINRIVAAVMTANSLNEDKLEKARQSFLATQLTARNGQSTHEGEQ